jgi:hypothetical protein
MTRSQTRRCASPGAREGSALSAVGSGQLGRRCDGRVVFDELLAVKRLLQAYGVNLDQIATVAESTR